MCALFCPERSDLTTGLTAVNPPSTMHLCPVTRRAAVDNNPSITSAISRAVPMLPSAYCFARASCSAGEDKNFAPAGMSIRPVATALKCMPLGRIRRGSGANHSLQIALGCSHRVMVGDTDACCNRRNEAGGCGDPSGARGSDERAQCEERAVESGAHDLAMLRLCCTRRGREQNIANAVSEHRWRAQCFNALMNRLLRASSLPHGERCPHRVTYSVAVSCANTGVSR